MTLVISKGIALRKGYIGTDDPDAEAYIAAVEAADEIESPGVGALETATKVAIHSFVKGCKNDGIWPAIKASCILAGARTLAGALVPLAGTAPTNVGPFVSGDYNRKTGLVGDGSTKYLNSNRNNNVDPQNSNHNAVYITFANTLAVGVYMGATTAGNRNELWGQGINPYGLGLRTGGSPIATLKLISSVGFYGASRSTSANFVGRFANSSTTYSSASISPNSANVLVFARNLEGSPNNHIDGRLAFYSIGESLDLALLDARVTDLINAFAAAMP
jgi:hypothetical protein